MLLSEIVERILIRNFSITKLRKITVIVHAKREGVSIYFLDSKILVPIEYFGVHKTSAATPAFHAMPIEVVKDDINAEKIDGK